MSEIMSTDPEAPLDDADLCWICDRPALAGDEPGRVPMAMWPNDVWVPNCSEACADAWFVQPYEAEVAGR